MEFIGYISSCLIGFSLGLLGAGGSILTVPVLVYLFRIEPVVSVKYSLFVVGVTSAFALIPRIRQREVLFKQGAIFGLISMLTIWLAKSWLLPLIPTVLGHAGKYTISYGWLSMVAFALLMLIASRSFISPSDRKESLSLGIADADHKPHQTLLMITAMATGLVTALLGAGGGFLIIPCLMIFYKLDIKKSVGTSLFIIVINAAAGFVIDLKAGHLEWQLIITVTMLAILGSLAGQQFSKRIETKKLKQLFGWFIFSMGLIIIITQTCCLN